MRPEKLEISKHGTLGPDNDRNSLNARYLRSSFKGDRYVHYLEVGQSGTEFQVVIQNADPAAVSLIHDEAVRLSWRVSDTMLFDGD